MSYVKNYYVIISLIVLMVLRIFVSGIWFSTIILAGFLIALHDIIIKVYDQNKTIIIQRQKIRYAIVSIVLNAFFVIILVVAIINFIIGIKLICSATVLDEITIFTLLISLPQSFIIKKINKIIRT
jgi:hypothetical protein